MTNDFIALFKDTSLVSVIAVVELTKQYQILAKSSMRYLEIGLATAALYLVMSVPLGYLSAAFGKTLGEGAMIEALEIALDGVSKRFGSRTVLDGVSCRCPRTRPWP